MSQAIMVLVSCQDTNEAERLSELLLKEKLAACCTTLPHSDSIFLWPPGKARLDYAKECILMIKTLDEKWSAVEKQIITSHSYENPEIIAIPLLHVTKKYLTWMEHELS